MYVTLSSVRQVWKAFQIIRVLAHTLLIFIILICVLIFFLFSIFRACCNHCFVLWRHTQFHLTVFSSVFLSCAVQFDLFVQFDSHSGWLLLKWSTIGLGFDGAETNCRIPHILGTLLMISY